MLRALGRIRVLPARALDLSLAEVIPPRPESRALERLHQREEEAILVRRHAIRAQTLVCENLGCGTRIGR
eukprot:3930866-Rhodomonas_salina.2